MGALPYADDRPGLRRSTKTKDRPYPHPPPPTLNPLLPPVPESPFADVHTEAALVPRPSPTHPEPRHTPPHTTTVGRRRESGIHRVCLSTERTLPCRRFTDPCPENTSNHLDVRYPGEWDWDRVWGPSSTRCRHSSPGRCHSDLTLPGWGDTGREGFPETPPLPPLRDRGLSYTQFRGPLFLDVPRREPSRLTDSRFWSNSVLTRDGTRSQNGRHIPPKIVGNGGLP